MAGRLITGQLGAKTTSPPATALRISTSLQGIPIALLLAGQMRMSVNILDYWAFNSLSSSSSGGGGKGGGGGSANTQYYVSFIAAVCEGPVASFGTIYTNGSIGLGTNSGAQDFNGTYNQGPSSAASFFGHTLSYRGIVNVAVSQLALGSSSTLPQINVAPLSTNNGFVPGQPDGDPSIGMATLLTNPYWNLGFPPARLNLDLGPNFAMTLVPSANPVDPTSWRSYCKALGFGVSWPIAASVQASSALGDVVTATNSAACWQDGQLTVVPYGDTGVQQGAVTPITETYEIPVTSTDAPVIVVGNKGTFVANQKVAYGNGVPLELVPFPPQNVGQYSLPSPGAYWFNYLDMGQTVNITYTYAAAASYVPQTQPIYDFTIDDFLPNQGTIGTGLSTKNSPVVVVRKPRDQMLNDIKVEYLDRNNSYNTVDIEIKDAASIVTFGKTRTSDIKQYHFFALASAAVQSAALQLVRAQIARQFQITVGGHFIIILQLMAIATLTMPQMGLDRQPVRIIEIQENQDQTLTVTFEEFPGTAAAPIYGSEASVGYQVNYNQSPGALNPPIIFEPTDELGSALISGGGLMIAAALSGASTSVWGGCVVQASYDGVNYEKVTTVNGPARVGVLTAELPFVATNPTGQTIDTLDTLSVDLTESAGILTSGSQLDATSLNTKCYVGPGLNPIVGDWNPADFALPDWAGAITAGEIVAYQTATLTAPSKYNLTWLVRGAYGTENNIYAWPAGTSFARIDNSVVTFPYDQSRIGATIFLKFQSFNIWGGGLQELEDCAPYAYSIKGSALASPLPDITGLTTVFVDGRLNLSWDIIDDFRPGVRYQIMQGDTFAGAMSLGTVAHPPFVVPGNGTFWVSGWCQPAPGLIVLSENPVSIEVAGTTVITNIVDEFSCKANGWSGTFTGGAGVDGAIDAVRTGGSGNVLTDVNILGEGDILDLGGNQDGTYSPAFIVDANYVTTLTVTISMLGTGVPDLQNILSDTNILGVPDFLGSASAAFVDVYPQVLVAQGGPGNILGDSNILTDVNVLESDFPFAAPVDYVPGDYYGQSLAFVFNLDTVDPATIAYLLSAIISVQAPPRVDHILTDGSIPSTGLVVAFTPDGTSTPAPFNNGLNGASVPGVFVSWNQTAGDTLQVTNLTVAGCKITIVNGGVGVTRANANVFAEGY